MTEREEFEVWAKSQHFGTEKTYKGSGNYLSGWTHFCWLAWQAARQQVVLIALPEPVNVGEMGEYAQAMRRGFDSCLRELKRLNPSLFEAAPQAEQAPELVSAACICGYRVTIEAFEPCDDYPGNGIANWDTHCECPRCGCHPRQSMGKRFETKGAAINARVEQWNRFVVGLSTAPPTPDVSVLVEAHDHEEHYDEDMTDPANWRVGDLVECIDSSQSFTRGKLYEIQTPGVSMVIFKADDSGLNYNGKSAKFFRFHSRPSQWIEWSGGECPCDGLSYIEIERRSGVKVQSAAKYFDWLDASNEYDIIRYRML